MPTDKKIASKNTNNNEWKSRTEEKLFIENDYAQGIEESIGEGCLPRQVSVLLMIHRRPRTGAHRSKIIMTYLRRPQSDYTVRKSK